MFAIVITEKGGGERRELFERSEVNVGRVHGNELLLPKGNVSKRHARLLHRDGRFIVTDLKSTNGTYVNGRKIAQATIVREGDKIFVGDYVLRVEFATEEASGNDAWTADGSRGSQPDGTDSEASASIASRGRLPSQNATLMGIPGATPIPSPAAFPSRPSAPANPTQQRRGSPADRGYADSNLRRAAVAALGARIENAVDLSGLESGAAPSATLRAAVETAIEAAVPAMRASGEIPAVLDLDLVATDARLELLDFGPLTPLLQDEDVTEVQVVRHDHVLVFQGDRSVSSDATFSSEQALAKVLRRLCTACGRALDGDERYVERHLPEGARIFAVVPPAAGSGHVLVVRKPQRAYLSLDDLVRSGTLSRGMATFLGHCVTASANILVSGALGSGTTSLLAALAAAGSTDERVVLLQETDEIIVDQPHAIPMALTGNAEEDAGAIRAAARIRPDRLIVGAFTGSVAADVVAGVGDGACGLLVANSAPTLRQAVARLSADLATSRPGVSAESAREWLVSTFDIVIEVARLRDGRHRALRIAELGMQGAEVVIRDIFTFTIERTAAGGTVEGSFHPTGVVPRLVEDLAARGVSLDSSLFRRGAGR